MCSRIYRVHLIFLFIKTYSSQQYLSAIASATTWFCNEQTGVNKELPNIPDIKPQVLEPRAQGLNSMITSLPLFTHPALQVLWKAGEKEANKHTGKQNPVQTSKGFLGRRKCVALAMINLVHLSESRLRETLSCILEDYPLK